MAGLVVAAALIATMLVPVQQPRIEAVSAERPPPRVPPKVSLDLRYVEGGDPAHRLDLFVPGGHTTPRPLVIFIHGGSWSHGSKSVLGGGSPERVESFRDMLLMNGYAVASVEYRFSQVARFPAQLHDVKAAVRYLRSRAEEYHLDPDRFAAAGQSAGAHLAQLVAYTGDSHNPRLEGDLGVTGWSTAVSALVSYYGPSDLARVVPDRLKSRCQRGDHGAASTRGRLIGGDPEAPDMRSRVKLANPLTHVRIGSPPSMLLHGTRDCIVPARQSARLYRLLTSLGVEAEYLPLDAPHGGPKFHTLPVVTTRVLDFLDAHLDVEP